MNKPIKKNNVMFIETRFGNVLMSEAKSIFFKKGLIGFSNNQDFFLISNLFKKYNKFNLLQSANDSSLSFILYPVKEEMNNFFEEDVFKNICSNIEFKEDKTEIYLVVNIIVTEDYQKIYVNNQAPILFDTDKLRAVQYIINNNKYEIRREILL